MARIAVDAMGGDFAPREIVEGAAMAAQQIPGVEILLVGREADIKALEHGDLEIVHADDVIAMDDHDPARSVRRRRDSSISVASRLVSQGRADAAYSAGSTGAAMAAGVLEMGRISGVSRPGVCTLMPFPDQPTLLLDAGANADSRPEHLATYAILGSEYAIDRLGIAEPRVGLLSIGEEEGKGNELARAAYPLIAATGVNFIGNVEGRDIPSDRVDVVVTDGFTGNVALKLAEGLAKYLMGELLAIATSTPEYQEAFTVLAPGLLQLRHNLSTEATGGAVLLGVKGVCIIGHGSSNAQSVASALGVAARTVDAGLIARLAQRMAGAGSPSGEDT